MLLSAVRGPPAHSLPGAVEVVAGHTREAGSAGNTISPSYWLQEPVPPELGTQAHAAPSPRARGALTMTSCAVSCPRARPRARARARPVIVFFLQRKPV